METFWFTYDPTTTECTMRPQCYRSSRICIRRSDSLEFTAG